MNFDRLDEWSLVETEEVNGLLKDMSWHLGQRDCGFIFNVKLYFLSSLIFCLSRGGFSNLMENEGL